MSDSKDAYRPVSRVLGKPGSVLFIPGNQVMPWAVISITAVFLGLILNLSLVWTGIIMAWWLASFWILAGDNPSRFLLVFHRSPTYTRGYTEYKPLLKDLDSLQNNKE
jgi:hypothetical protein